MTAARVPNDYPHQVALGFYRDGDADSLRSFAKANPEHVWVQIEAAHLAADRKQPEAIMHYLGAAMKAAPEVCLNHWFYWQLIASAMAQLGDQGEGEHAAHVAVRLAPHRPLLWNTYATYAFHRGDQQAGFARLAKCIALRAPSPDDAKAQAEALLFLGRYKEGWKKWDARTALKSVVGTQQLNSPTWSGEPLHGKRPKRILVWAEQGAGDQIQFLRFLAPLRARGGYVILRLMASLLPWASALKDQGIVDELGIMEGELDVPDFNVPLLSLPHKLGRYQPKQWPAPWAPPVPLTPVPGRVGYAWRGNPDHGNDHDRSCPERAQFERDVGATSHWVNLTGGDPEAPVGWMDTARVIASCERIVTVDTAIAHVAGSLGVPTVTILASAPEWRWSHKFPRSTPWYPSMTLVRKRYIGGWTEALHEAASVARTPHNG